MPNIEITNTALLAKFTKEELNSLKICKHDYNSNGIIDISSFFKLIPMIKLGIDNLYITQFGHIIRSENNNLIVNDMFQIDFPVKLQLNMKTKLIRKLYSPAFADMLHELDGKIINE